MGGGTAGWAGHEVDSCLGEGAGGSVAVAWFPREVALFVFLDGERREGYTPISDSHYQHCLNTCKGKAELGG